MLEQLIHRRRDATKWRKIPWDEPEFSRRMLREHLSQEHDAASRRIPEIDQGVKWVHETLLGGKPSSILDLGCGPGLYTHRFANLGHTCKGIDFGPASIEYARTYHQGEFALGDVLSADYGTGYDLVCMIYGELNAFSPESAQRIVNKAYEALKPGGALLLEVSYGEAVQRMGQEPATWYTAESGIFSDKPHIVLKESSIVDGCSCAWHYVIDVETGALDDYVVMHQAYTNDEYKRLLRSFSKIVEYPSLTGDAQGDGELFVIVARK